MKIGKTALALTLTLAATSAGAANSKPDPVTMMTPHAALACLKKLTGDRVRATAEGVACSLEDRSSGLVLSNESRLRLGYEPLTREQWGALGTNPEKGHEYHLGGTTEVIFETGGQRPTRITVGKVLCTDDHEAYITFRRGNREIGERISGIYYDGNFGSSQDKTSPFKPGFVTAGSASMVPVKMLSKRDQDGVNALSKTTKAIVHALGKGPSKYDNKYNDCNSSYQYELNPPRP